MPRTREVLATPSPPPSGISAEEDRKQDVPETQFEPKSQDSQNLWDVEAILDERMYRGRGQFLLKWSGVDPHTGEDYQPTWEPKSSCSNALIRDWKNLKLRDPGIVGRYTREMEKNKHKKGKRKRNSTATAKRSRESEAGALRKPRQSTSRTDSPAVSTRASVATPQAKRIKLRVGPEIPVITIPDSPTPHIPSESSNSASPLVPEPAWPFGDGLGNLIPADQALEKISREASREASESSSEPHPISLVGNSSSDVPVAADKGVKLVPDLKSADDAPSEKDTLAEEGATESTKSKSNGLTTDSVENPAAGAVDVPAEEVPSPTKKEKSPAPEPRATRNLTKSPSVVSRSPPRRRPAGPKKIIDLSAPSTSRVTRASPISPAASAMIQRGPAPKLSSSTSRPFLPSDSTQTPTDRSAPASQTDPIAEFSSPTRLTRSVKHRQAQDKGVARVVEKVIDGETWMVDSQDQDSQTQSQGSAQGKSEESAKSAVRGTNSSGSVDHASGSFSERRLGSPMVVVERVVEVRQDGPNGSGGADSSHKETRTETTLLPTSNIAHRPNHPVSLTLIQEKNDEIARLQAQIQDLNSIIQNTPPARAPESTPEQQAASAAKDARIEALLAQIETMQGSIDDLTTRLTSSESSRQSLSGDYNFIQAQYQNASNRAVAEVQRCQKLEEQVKTLKSQLSVGLKQRDWHFEAAKQAKAKELQELKATTKFLLEQSRRTDDIVRKRAAAYPPLLEENELLREQLTELVHRADQLSARNEDLLEQVTILRGRQMGAFGDDDDGSTGDEESDADGDITGPESGSPLLNPVNRGGNGHLGYSIGAGGGGSNMIPLGEIGGFTASQLMPSDSQLLKESLDSTDSHAVVGKVALGPLVPEHEQDELDEIIVEGGVGYWCKWRHEPNSTRCTMMFDSHQDLVAHARNHIIVDTAAEDLA